MHAVSCRHDQDHKGAELDGRLLKPWAKSTDMPIPDVCLRPRSIANALGLINQLKTTVVSLFWAGEREKVVRLLA